MTDPADATAAKLLPCRCASYSDGEQEIHDDACAQNFRPDVAAELRRMQERIEALLCAGRPLANAAFNLEQDELLSDRVRSCLKEARVAWDNTVRQKSEAAAQKASG